MRAALREWALFDMEPELQVVRSGGVTTAAATTSRTGAGAVLGGGKEEMDAMVRKVWVYKIPGEFV